MAGNTLVIQFDTYLLKTKPDCLHGLAELYCRIFSMDPNFGEYRQCPICKRYFNYHQVEVEGVQTCCSGHSPARIVPAWVTCDVEKEILKQSREKGFFGAQALLYGEPVGFAWVRTLSLDQVGKEWGLEIKNMLKPSCPKRRVIYFDELGVDVKARNMGLGKALVEFICRWARDNHPDEMTLLRTHSKSRARTIFESVGYRKFADDTEFGGGRILMKSDKCRDLCSAY